MIDSEHYTVCWQNVQQFLQNIELTAKPLITNGFIAMLGPVSKDTARTATPPRTWGHAGGPARELRVSASAQTFSVTLEKRVTERKVLGQLGRWSE